MHKLNPKIDRISWNPIGFKENEEYKIQSVSTAGDKVLFAKAMELIDTDCNKTVVCSIEFLLALLTVRGGQYPWNI